MRPSDANGPVERQAISEFLTATLGEPTALLLEGEPGIGKTTLWLAALQEARDRGFRVLSATPAAAESVLAYGGLADLLSDVQATVLSHLPGPQRVALEGVLLRVSTNVLATDYRAVAAGFLSVIVELAEQSPVLLAVDDLQWLDPSSVHVLTFVARRLPQGAGMLGTVRADPEGAATWLQLPQPDAIRRIQLRPLSLGELHAVLRERIDWSLSRLALVRIHRITGGNPFYAIELARAMGDAATGDEIRLPGTLMQLVRARVGRLDTELRDVLLAAACPAEPTIDLIAGALGVDAHQVVAQLENSEAHGIVVIEGSRVRFTHPLLAHGVYTDAAPASRRQMHRRMAALIAHPELRARHLALSATTCDPDILSALDEAAEMARIRGAPAAAAELLELAIKLGGDTQERQIGLAGHLADAGDPGRARTFLEDSVSRLAPGVLRAHALSMLGSVRLFDDSFLEAADHFERALGEVGDDLVLEVTILITLTFALYNAGRLEAAVETAEQAVAHATRLGQSHLLSQALGMRVVSRFVRGGGLDHAGLRRALELEEPTADTPIVLRPSMHHAQLLSWTTQFDEAHDVMLALRRRCIERGRESDLVYVAFQNFMLEIWRGNFTEAGLLAEDVMQRALQLGSDVPLCVAYGMRAGVAAYAGRHDDARCDADAAFEATRRCGSPMLAVIPTVMVGFVEVSVGSYEAALAALQPLLAQFDPTSHRTEIADAFFVPDAVEAMVHVGRSVDAEPLIEALERNGRRLDRAWMLAVGGRCRAMLLAAAGDVDAATQTAQQAMFEHDRLPMPFERARTQLLLGQLQRRQRHKDSAAATVREALATFDSLGTSLWAARAGAELARANIGPRRGDVLTPSEQRVGELAASGLTNREVAAELFISPKTVESTLARIYRKLGIRSRAELGMRMLHADP